MKKTIRDFDLKNKKVIIRVDFNVPICDGKIIDDTRIKESIPTISYALSCGAKVILMSHLGRIKSEDDKKKNSLECVSKRLSSLIKKDVLFIPYTRGEVLENAISSMKQKDVILMENTRFEDFPKKLESGNDEALGKYWASLGDIFINDAFGTCHRSHASNVGIASYLPSGIGLLVEKEIKNLSIILNSPKRPFSVILGGAKISDKITLIDSLAKCADNVLIGGAMAFTFLRATGLNVGSSLVDEDSISIALDLLKKYENKIILPIDAIVSDSINGKGELKFVSDIKKDDIGLDIGSKTVEIFSEYLKESKTILWNGPVGYVENSEFQQGTKGLCETIKNIDACKIVGGGDSASAIINLGYKDYMTHISTGGGASLEFIEGKQLPGIVVINDL